MDKHTYSGFNIAAGLLLFLFADCQRMFILLRGYSEILSLVKTAQYNSIYHVDFEPDRVCSGVRPLYLSAIYNTSSTPFFSGDMPFGSPNS